MIKPEKLSKEVVDLLLARLQNEYEAFYLYRSASNWCANVGFKKSADYFKSESDDELSHAKRLEQYLVDWNVIPSLPNIKSPELTFRGLADIIEKAYKIELELYEAYEETSAKVFKSGDIGVFDFLKQYLEIQTKSVAEYSDMLNILDGVDVNDKFKMLLLEENLFGE